MKPTRDQLVSQIAGLAAVSLLTVLLPWCCMGPSVLDLTLWECVHHGSGGGMSVGGRIMWWGANAIYNSLATEWFLGSGKRWLHKELQAPTKTTFCFVLFLMVIAIGQLGRKWGAASEGSDFRFCSGQHQLVSLCSIFFLDWNCFRIRRQQNEYQLAYLCWNSKFLFGRE